MMEEDDLINAIDRTLTDLLPDKHKYEADLQLYLDYSLPPHPDIPLPDEPEDPKAPETAADNSQSPEVSTSTMDRDWLEQGDAELADAGQPSGNAAGPSEITPEAIGAWPRSAENNEQDTEELGAYDESSVAAEDGHEYIPIGESRHGGDTSDARRDSAKPTHQPSSPADPESSMAVEEMSGFAPQRISEPTINGQDEQATDLSVDAGHIMPLRKREGSAIRPQGGQGSEGEAEKRVLMNAVSTLKMENACLVATLGSRVTEIEALRCALDEARQEAQAGQQQVPFGAQQASDGAALHHNQTSGTASQAFVMNDRAEQRFRKLEMMVGQLRAERARYEKALRREVGEDLPLQKVLDEASDWRGRAQQISLLQERLLSLQESQGEAGKAQRTKHDQQHRDNLIRIKGDKQREIDRLRGELEECQAALAVSQAKEQAVTSRKKMLEKEACLIFPTFATYSWPLVKSLRQKIGLLLDKSATDDKLIGALRTPIAHYAPAAVMPGPSGSMNSGSDMHSENGDRLASLPEHLAVLGQVGQHNSGSAKPVVVPLLRLQPSLEGQCEENAAEAPNGEASESVSPVHRVSFAISMDISALSGTSSNVEIVPVAETLIQQAHSQLSRPSISVNIPRAEATSQQRHLTPEEGIAGTQAQHKSDQASSYRNDGEEDGAKAVDASPTSEASETVGTEQSAGEEKDLETIYTEGQVSVETEQQDMPGHASPSKEDRPPAAGDGRAARGASDTIQAHWAGGDRPIEVLRQTSHLTEAAALQSARKGSAIMLLQPAQQGLVEETPRGLVAKSVVDNIISQL